MATFPDVLCNALENSYRYEVQSGVIQSPLAATPKQQRRTNDRLRIHSLRYVFSRGQARLFRQWLIEQADNGYKPCTFTIDGRTFEAKFRNKPRMDGLRSSKSFSYSFELVERL